MMIAHGSSVSAGWLMLAADDGASKSILQYIHSGGVLSYLLVALSVLALALLITNFIVLRLGAMAPPAAVDALERLLREKNFDGAIQYCRQRENDSFLTRIMADGLAKASRSQFGMLELKPAIEEAATKQLDRIEKPNHGLATLAAVGPMLGLLGTVIGIIGAFGAISAAEGAARSNELAGHMSIALVCTAEGLIIAIPCTVAYALFKRRTDRLAMQVAEIAEALVAPLQSLQAPGVAAARPAAPAQRPVPPAAQRPAPAGSAQA